MRWPARPSRWRHGLRAIEEGLHPEFKRKELPNLHGPILRPAAMLVHEFPYGFRPEQSPFANARFREQIAGHFFQIVGQPVIDGRAKPAFGCVSTSRGKTSFIAWRKMYLVVGRKKPLSFSFGGTFQATNSASSRSRNGTRTSTEEAILILSL